MLNPPAARRGCDLAHHRRLNRTGYLDRPARSPTVPARRRITAQRVSQPSTATCASFNDMDRAAAYGRGPTAYESAEHGGNHHDPHPAGERAATKSFGPPAASSSYQRLRAALPSARRSCSTHALPKLSPSPTRDRLTEWRAPAAGDEANRDQFVTEVREAEGFR